MDEPRSPAVEGRRSDDAARDYISGRVKEGASREAIVQELVQRGYDPTTARDMVGGVMRKQTSPRQSGLIYLIVGLIIIPIVGNIAEHVVAVQVALENKMDLSLGISLGSSIQIAIFVAPVLVFVGRFMGIPLTLEFNTYELFALGGAAVIAALVTVDGESNWLEGAQLLVLYAMLAVAFFFL